MIRIRAKRISNLADLQSALQNAIRLEHATIPPYLTAWFTLAGKSDGAKYARSEIRRIVMQEMLHLQLAANILNAIGGSPVIDDPGFVPDYPCPLPMGIGDDDGDEPGKPLIVGLKRYSRQTIEKVFMQIEEPATPIDIPIKGFAAGGDTYKTIGEFYAGIRQEIENQGEDAFKSPINQQVPDKFYGDEFGEVEVTNVASALKAIDVIVQQGEGTSQSPLDLEGDFAHYYRFAELAKGMQIEADPKSPVGYSFNPQKPIVVDDKDVIDMVDNPQLEVVASKLSKDEDAEVLQLADECDRIYTNLLKALHQAFNNKLDKWGDARNLMSSLQSAAGQLLAYELKSGPYAGKRAGPRFRYLSST